MEFLQLIPKVTTNQPEETLEPWKNQVQYPATETGNAQ
jgi:hypothetical protein